jgi:glycerol uptake facilitator-like aquaporin
MWQNTSATGLIIGFALRALVLFTLGANGGLLNPAVRDRKTLFQMAFLAPAIVGGNDCICHTPAPNRSPRSNNKCSSTTKIAYIA